MKKFFIFLLALVSHTLCSSQTVYQKNNIDKNLSGPTYLGTADHGYWEVNCYGPIILTDNGICMNNINIYGVEGNFPMIGFDLWDESDSEFHDLNLKVWNESKVFPITIFFTNGQSITADFDLGNRLKAEFKDSNAFYIRFIQEPFRSNDIMTKFWKLILNYNVEKLTINGHTIVLNNFTYSKYLFHSLMKLYSTKVKTANEILKDVSN